MSIFKKIRGLVPGGREQPVRVVTDSTADLPRELAEQFDITVVPLTVVFGSETFRDGVDLSSEEFFRRLPGAVELPTTSQPSVGEFQAAYEALAETTKRILSIHLSSGFSGTVDAARQAAATLGDRCTIEVIDSDTVSMAMGLAVIAAARAARDGEDLTSCAGGARSVLSRQRLAVAVDTLEYLRRGGRIGRAAAFLGGLLRLKPILTIRDGAAFPLARVRTRRKALDRVLEICLDSGGNVVEAAVMHANSPDDAAFLASEIERRVPGVPVHVGRFGPVIGVHGGPGMTAITVVLDAAPEEPPQA